MLEDRSKKIRSTPARIARLALVILLVFLGGISVVAWISDDSADLAFEYDGFD